MMPESKRAGRNARSVTVWAVLLIFIATTLTISPWGQRQEERLGLHGLFHMRGPLPSPRAVVIVAITERSGPALGLPESMTRWSRAVYARMLDILIRLHADSIVIDIFFESAADTPSLRQGDLLFAQSIRNAGNVTLFAYTQRQMVELASSPDIEPITLDQIIEPAAIFANAAQATAPFVLPKIPTLVSRFTLHTDAQSKRPVLPLAALQHSGEHSSKEIESLHGTRLFNFYGPPRSIRTVFLEDLLSTPEKYQEGIRQAAVFVGFSSRYQFGQQDNFTTVFSDGSGLDLSGVELAATAFANLRDDTSLRHCGGLCAVISVFVLGVLMWFAIGFFPQRWAVGVLLLATVYAVQAYAWFVVEAVWLPMIIPLLVLTPCFIWLGYRTSIRRSQQSQLALAHAFGRYLPRSEIAKVTEQPDGWPQQKKVFGVCMVTDASGYTGLAERLPADELSELMSAYYAALIRPIRQHGGLISDVAGDGVIALWTDIPRQKVLDTLMPAAAVLRQAVDLFNAQHPDTPLRTRIGLHAGEVMLGHYGADDHYEFRAVGDIVNTASRIESFNKQLNTDYLISEACLPANDTGRADIAILRYLGMFQLCGKHNAVRLYAPALVNDQDGNTLFRAVERLLQLGDTQAALQILRRRVIACPDDGPARFFVGYLSAHQEQVGLSILPIRIQDK